MKLDAKILYLNLETSDTLQQYRLANETVKLLFYQKLSYRDTLQQYRLANETTTHKANCTKSKWRHFTTISLS